MSTIRVTYVVPAEREDEVVAALWARGTAGVQVVDGGEAETVRLEAWFEGEPPDGPVAGCEAVTVEEVPETDWMAPYRALAKPFEVGERLLLDPRDPDLPGEGDAGAAAPDGRTRLRIPARAAFGTGSHESTRLVLELLEECDLAGARVLDVGTGTGVLAFAALLFGARSAVALDVDPAAPCHAWANARLNREPLGGRSPALFAGTAAALAERAGLFDLALVNVIPEEIADDLPHVLGLLAPGGGAIFSGILAEHGPRVLAGLTGRGLDPVAERAAGEWVAFRTRKRGGP